MVAISTSTSWCAASYSTSPCCSGFATHGGRCDALLGPIVFIQAAEDHPALTLLARHIGGTDDHH